jgi:hypothetical protein
LAVILRVDCPLSEAYVVYMTFLSIVGWLLLQTYWHLYLRFEVFTAVGVQILVVCDTMQPCMWLSTFRSNILLPSSG